MRIYPAVCIVLLLSSAEALAARSATRSATWPASDNAEVVGTWEGESKCTVPNSPCRDEHVVYRIAAKKDNPATLTIDADKIVDGSAQFMGSLDCEYRANRSILSCTAHTPKQDDWEFQVSGEAMTGTLKLGVEKTLYRRVTLRKTHAKEK